MRERQEKLLNLVVENHIKTSEPIGSRFLLSQACLNCGEATVRNELRELEEEGYLTHPHTSAGRVPTQKAYRYFVNSIEWGEVKTDQKQNAILKKSWDGFNEKKEKQKKMARSLSELSKTAVILAFSPDMVYYTGISNLFGQEYIQDFRGAFHISKIFDYCEDHLPDLFERSSFEPSVFIGDEHDFGSSAALLSVLFPADEKNNGLLIVLGSQRMDYKNNYGLLKRSFEILSC